MGRSIFSSNNGSSFLSTTINYAIFLFMVPLDNVFDREIPSMMNVMNSHFSFMASSFCCCHCLYWGLQGLRLSFVVTYHPNEGNVYFVDIHFIFNVFMKSPYVSWSPFSMSSLTYLSSLRFLINSCGIYMILICQYVLTLL